MKYVIHILTFLFVSQSIAQTVIIDVIEVKSNCSFGRTTLEQVLNDPDILEEPRSSNSRFVFNFQDSTSTFYKNGRFVSETAIEFKESSPGVYTILSHDTDNETYTKDVPVNIQVNTNQGEELFLFKYYDSGMEQTVLDVGTEIVVVREV
jgi:hypothetical protein